MASTAMIHFSLDPGKLIRFLGGEYTGYFRDVQKTLQAVRDHVSPKDLAHMERILLNGCPAELTFEEPLSNKMEVISRGNSKSFNKNLDIVKKTMNKEDRYSSVVPINALICLLSPYLQHTAQTMVLKEDKCSRLCFNATTTQKNDIVMNQVTPVRRKAPIAFGKVKQQLYTDIYNTSISYPLAVILIAMGNIKACFRFARIHADLTGAFGFFADDLCNLATTMVFGSTASASSWEPFRQAIESLSEVCQLPRSCPEAQKIS